MFDDPNTPPSGPFERVFRFLLLVAYLRLAVLFIFPYVAYAFVRDIVRNAATVNKVYILERNPPLWETTKFLPPDQADGKVTCYAVANSVREATDWLRSRGYKIEDLNCDNGVFDFFVKPIAENGRFPAERESVVELVIDYGDSRTECLCQQGKVDTQGFARVAMNEIYLPEDIGRKYDNCVIYKRYGGRLGPVEVIKKPDGIWYSQ